MAPMVNPDAPMMMSETATEEDGGGCRNDEVAPELIAKIEKRTREYVQTPACTSISSLVMVEVAIAFDAAPGERELRLVTPRGVSNPLVFHVGQLPEFAKETDDHRSAPGPGQGGAGPPQETG